MPKLTREQKIEIYAKWKNGESSTRLSKTYGVRRGNLDYLVSLIDMHGFEILREKTNKQYSLELKQEIINKVLLEKHSKYSTALTYGLSSCGLLVNWIKSYKEAGYVIVEKKKGGQSTMTKHENVTKKYEEMTPEEKIKHLEKKNLYLEAENEYLKKLDAVIKARKHQLPKKK